MRHVRSFLTVFLLAVCFSAHAFDACVFIDITEAKKIPGWSALQTQLYPELATETEKKLHRQGIQLSISEFSFLLENDIFDMHLKGLTEAQLEYLLTNKMIHPDWRYRKENSSFYISNGDAPELAIHVTKTGLRFTNGEIKQKAFLNFKKQKGLILQGLILCEDKKDLHPALSDVKLIYIYLFKSGDQILIDLFIRGNDKQAEEQILKDLNFYFAQLYSQAIKETLLDASLLNIYHVSRNQGWIKLRITLTDQQAKTFFTQFSSTLQEMLPR